MVVTISHEGYIKRTPLSAYNAQKPILMYFWTPHWAQEKYDLTMVKRPDVTDACTQAAADGTDAYACAYPPDHCTQAPASST